MIDLSDKIIHQNYHLLAPISTSRLSIVYQARDLQTNHLVAVKFFKEGVVSTYFEDIIRFKKECSILNRLHHPHIVRIHETGEYNDQPYWVMELLSRATLANLLQNAKQYTELETVAIIKQLAQTLNFIHRHGVIHRDLKPGNIFIVNPEQEINLKLLDFGQMTFPEKDLNRLLYQQVATVPPPPGKDIPLGSRNADQHPKNKTNG